MKITKKSILSGITRTLEIPITQKQIDNWQKGMHIQHAMPNISPSEREFIKTGITSEEWDEEFKEDFTH